MERSIASAMAPCPFCGNADAEELSVRTIERGNTWALGGVEAITSDSRVCNAACSCGAIGPDAETRDEAVEAWNAWPRVIPGIDVLGWK